MLAILSNAYWPLFYRPLPYELFAMYVTDGQTDGRTKATLILPPSSRLAYCNALLHGLPNTLLRKLQSVQNATARLITGTRRCDHITPVLRELHWLPIRERVKFKLACQQVSPVAVRAVACLPGIMTVTSSRTADVAFCGQPMSRRAWYHEPTAALATEPL